MLSLLRSPVRHMRKRAGERIAYGLDFRNPVPMVHGFDLVVIGHTIELQLIDEHGQAAVAAILPRMLLEDKT